MRKIITVYSVVLLLGCGLALAHEMKSHSSAGQYHSLPAIRTVVFS